MRVVITNTRVANAGDAAILLGLERGLRERADDVELSVHDDDAARAGERLGRDVRPQLQAAIASSRARRALAWLALRTPAPLRRRLLRRAGGPAAEPYLRADVVVSTGGTYMSDRYDPSPRLRELQLAMALERPVVLGTQSIGPISRRSTRAALRRIASGAALVMVRDDASRAELARAGADGRVVLAADPAFALADPAVLERARRPRDGAGPPRVAISVRSWPHFERMDTERSMRRYIAAVAALTDQLVRARGAHVTFVSTCQGDPSYGHDDSVIAYMVAARLAPAILGSVTVDGRRRDPDELIAELGRHHLAVTTRLHAGILALAAGTPALFIAYEEKAFGVAERLGTRELVEPMEGISAWRLIAAADRMLDGEAELRPRLFDRVEQQRREALDFGRLVREAVGAA